MDNERAVNPIPMVVAVLCLIVVGVELVLSAGAAGFIGGPQAIGWRLNAFSDYGFTPSVLDWMITRGDYSFDLLKHFVTYPFIQTDAIGTMFGAAILLALGKFVGEVFRATAVLAIFFLSAIVGAIAFGLAFDGTSLLIGVFPSVYGLIGAYTYIIWLRLGQNGQNQLAAFRMIGFLLGLQLVFGMLFGGNPMWVAELAGFVTGFASSTVLAPGGWTALLHRLRQRR